MYGTHARVLKGYDDSTGVYVVHDPWYDGVYQGPDVHFNQDFLVDELWPRSHRWGGFIAPWEVDIVAPDEVMRGSSFTLTATVFYTSAHPFSGDDVAQFPTVTLLPSELHRLSPGESATRTLTGNFSYPGCEVRRGHLGGRSRHAGAGGRARGPRSRTHPRLGSFLLELRRLHRRARRGSRHHRRSRHRGRRRHRGRPPHAHTGRARPGVRREDDRGASRSLHGPPQQRPLLPRQEHPSSRSRGPQRHRHRL